MAIKTHPGYKAVWSHISDGVEAGYLQNIITEKIW